MKLTTCLLPAHDRPDAERNADAAVVIDVLRATSVMVTALHHGAGRIVTCREVTEAESLDREIRPKPLLCGERGCKLIPGFDLGNSPAEYLQSRVQGRTLVLTTTNGTRAIAAVDDVPRVFIASFLNLSAVVDALNGTRRIHLVCAGTEGCITLEDTLLAGAILWKCQVNYGAELEDDTSILALQLWRSWFADQVAVGRLPEPPLLSYRFRETRGGKNLLRLGFDGDLDRCAVIDSIPVVPERVLRSPASFALKHADAGEATSRT